MWCNTIFGFQKFKSTFVRRVPQWEWKDEIFLKVLLSSATTSMTCYIDQQKQRELFPAQLETWRREGGMTDAVRFNSEVSHYLHIKLSCTSLLYVMMDSELPGRYRYENVCLWYFFDNEINLEQLYWSCCFLLYSARSVFFLRDKWSIHVNANEWQHHFEPSD